MCWLLSWTRGGLDKVQSFSDVRPVNGRGFRNERILFKKGTKCVRVTVDVVNWTCCVEELVLREEDNSDVNILACKGHG